MKKFLYLISIGLLLASNLFSQSEKQYREVPFQIGLVPPLSTNGTQAPNTVNQTSLNLLVGLSAGLDGFEASSFLNIERDFVKGAQLSGFDNIVGNEADAVQMAGFINVVGGPFNGVQASGFANLNGDYTEAIQLAGFVNTADELDGIQLSGFGNYTGDAVGVQASGFINVADDIEGVQLAGFINIADNVKGAQVSGFINICDSIDGIPISFLNIVRKNGYRKFEFWSNETYFMNLSYKLGVRQFYTIFTGSYRPTINDYNWAYGVGFGSSFILGQSGSMEIEGVAYNIVNKDYLEFDEYNSYYQLKIGFTHHFHDHLAIFGGPSFNISVSEDYTSGINDLLPKWSYNLYDKRDKRVESWFGFFGGLRF